jgi:cytochrome P450
VRINPDEVHILDPEYYDTIHGSSTVKRDKYAAFVVLANAPTSSFATVSHEHHRLRRKGINHLFSKLAISKFEPSIQAKVDILASRFRQAIETKEVIRADVAYNALTMDTICQYGFAQDDNFLMEPDFKLAWKETLKGASRAGAFIRAFPSVLTLLNILPTKFIGFLAPRMAVMVEWQVAAKERIKLVLAKEPEPGDGEKERTKATSLFEAMRDSDLPPEEKTLQRFVDESQTWIAAGTETVAKVLYTITTHLLADKSKAEALRKELRQALIKPTSHLSTATLEQMPYLVSPYIYSVWYLF